MTNVNVKAARILPDLSASQRISIGKLGGNAQSVKALVSKGLLNPDKTPTVLGQAVRRLIRDSDSHAVVIGPCSRREAKAIRSFERRNAAVMALPIS